MPQFKDLTEQEQKILRDSYSDDFDLSRIDNPNWPGKRFSWEYYIPQNIEDVWNQLSRESRLVALVFASRDADRDEPSE